MSRMDIIIAIKLSCACETHMEKAIFKIKKGCSTKEFTYNIL
jgi:hypothetical protein